MKLLATILLFSIQFAFAFDEALVGLAINDVTPEVEDKIPLGGYGSLARRNFPFRFSFSHRPLFRTFKTAIGTLDPIRAKAMFIKNADKKLLFLSLDLIGVTKEIHRDLINKLASEGFDTSEVIISGTHTHSGPGGLSSNFFWQLAAMDSFQKAYYARFLDQIVKTIREAIENAAPADLHTLSFDTQGLQNNRRTGDRPLYPRANLLLAKAKSGEWLGGMVNFAVHGTSLGDDNLFFSSDVPGAIEHSLEELINEKNGLVRLSDKAKILFVNGAEGDVSPRQEYRALGLEFAKQTAEQWENLKPLSATWTSKQLEVPMGKPKIYLSKCGKRIPKWLKFGLKKFISSTTLITQVHFGNLWFLTWPGEATTELGINLIAAAKESGAKDAWVMGLSNDHLAYFVTEGEFDVGGYEACLNFFGRTGGTKIIQAHKQIFQNEISWQ
jgi:hypothetical protein